MELVRRSSGCRVAHGEGLLAGIAARAPVELDGARLGGVRRHEVIAAHMRQIGQRWRAAVDDSVVDQAQVVVALLGQHAVDLEGVHQPAEQVRDFAIEVPGLVILEPALVAIAAPVAAGNSTASSRAVSPTCSGRAGRCGPSA